MTARLPVHDLETAFRRCLGLSCDAAVSLTTKGYTLPEAAAALMVNLSYLKGVLRGTYRSPRLLRKIAELPTRQPVTSQPINQSTSAALTSELARAESAIRQQRDAVESLRRRTAAITDRVAALLLR